MAASGYWSEITETRDHERFFVRCSCGWRSEAYSYDRVAESAKREHDRSHDHGG